MNNTPKQYIATVNDSSVNYYTYGANNDIPVVMVHGFRGTHEGLELIAKELSDYHVIVPDLPGFGGSEPFLDSTHDLTAYTNFVDQFIKSLKLKQKPVLLGHSFGSIVASSFAATNPDKISKLILINPIGAPALEGPKAVLSRLAIFYYYLGQKLPRGASHIWLSAKPMVWTMSKTMTKTKDKELIRYIDNQHYTHFSRFANPDVVSGAFKTSVSHTVREFAPKISLPTLLIVGDKDDITPLNKQKELVKLFKDAKLKIITNVGHLVHYEAPRQAAKMIRDFVG